MNSSSAVNKIAFGLVLALLMIATLAYGAVHQFVLGVVYILITALAFLWASDCFRTGKIRFSTSLLQLPLIAAAVYGLIQIIPFGTLPDAGGVADIHRTISLEPFATQVSALHFLILLVFFAVLLTLLDSASRIRKVVIFLSVFGFAFAFFAILQSVLSPDKIYGVYGRLGGSPFGSFVNRNHFAAWMELAAAIPLGILISGAVAKDKRLLYITATALMGISLIVSGSRGGLVALLVEVFFLFLVTHRSTGKRRAGVQIVLAVGLIAIIVAGSFFVGGETSLTRISADQTATAADSNSSRSHIWRVTLKLIGDSMPFGVGLGAFGTAYGKFDDSSGLERVEQAHNDYLQVLSDAGLVGAVIGIAFLFLLFQAGRRVLRVEDPYLRAVGTGALAGILAVLVHSIFDFVLHTTAVALMFLTAISILIAANSSFTDDLKNGGQQKDRTRRRHSSAEITQPTT